jgi:hypothetical protein
VLCEFDLNLGRGDYKKAVAGLQNGIGARGQNRFAAQYGHDRGASDGATQRARLNLLSNPGTIGPENASD